jgi:hypothetical protein
MRVGKKFVVAALLMVTMQATVIPQGRHASASNHPSEALKTFVRGYVNDSSPDMRTKIKVVRIMAANGKIEYLVYVSGQPWCGSGGCTLLILEASGSTFKVRGDLTIVRLPIRVLASTNYGHPDIGVTVQGGGVVVGYEAVLSFDGENYPSNPSEPPARKLTAIQGKMVMANTEGSVPLYN